MHIVMINVFPMRSLRSQITGVLFGLSLLFGGLAVAQAQAPQATSAPALKSELQAFVVVTDAKGQEQFQKAEGVKPGDVIEYRMSHRNISKNLVNKLQFDLPIPVGTTWLKDQAAPAKPMASAVIGGEFEALPLMRTVKDAKGVEKKVPVPIEQYRVLRWSLPSLAAGQSFEARARVRVLENTAAPSTAPPGNPAPAPSK